MSTSISDLDSAPALGDGDFVQNILNEMNGGSGGGGGGGSMPPQLPPIQPPPAIGGYQQGVINAPNPNTISPHVMDNGPATAHIIGNSHPTPADFAQMMATGGGGHGGGPAAAPQGQWAAGAAAYAPGPAQPQYIPSGPAKRSWLTKLADEFRTTFFVIILVFAFSLPVVNFLFAHYLPSMVKPTGELTLIGLLIKSIAAGSSFWVLQRVIVPLLSL